MKENNEKTNSEWEEFKKNPRNLNALIEICLLFFIIVLVLVVGISIKWILIFGFFFVCSRLGEIAIEIRKVVICLEFQIRHPHPPKENEQNGQNL